LRVRSGKQLRELYKWREIMDKTTSKKMKKGAPMPLAALCATLILMLAACTPGQASRPMTLSHFESFCKVFPTPNSCDSTTICGDFSNVLSSRASGLDDCLARCRRTKYHLQPSNVVNNCGATLSRASDLCAQFCRGNYPQ
jgi:hypothetical protein